ncbi:helix-turn-helix domain-containing protein [Azospirillum ramasamyi]|nr:helix-turn-helix transcriptional regulator [Azospirillum ramasamyi]
MFMSKPATATKTLPTNAALALKSLGERLRIARERRGESLRAWAVRLDVSVPTLQRMEGGDPTVGMGVYATAIWLCGRHEALADVMEPAADAEAQEIEIMRASRRRK